jgi:hypothetical protein
MPPIFIRCVRIVLSGLVSGGLPCCRLLVAIRCRLTRQLVGRCVRNTYGTGSHGQGQSELVESATVVVVWIRSVQ